MNGVPRLPLIPGFGIHVNVLIEYYFKILHTSKYRSLQRPRENSHLPNCFSRLDGTKLFVEKSHEDKNSTLNDNKVYWASSLIIYISWNFPHSIAFSNRFYVSKPILVKILMIAKSTKFVKWKFYTLQKMEPFKWADFGFLFGIVSEFNNSIYYFIRYSRYSFMHRETSTNPMWFAWILQVLDISRFECSETSENSRPNIHHYRLWSNRQNPSM